MSKHKMCKSEITYNEEQHSVYAVKFNVMQKQIDKLEEFSEQLMEERNVYMDRWNRFKDWILKEEAIHTEDDTINTLYDCIVDKIQELEEKIK